MMLGNRGRDLAEKATRTGEIRRVGLLWKWFINGAALTAVSGYPSENIPSESFVQEAVASGK